MANEGSPLLQSSSSSAQQGIDYNDDMIARIRHDIASEEDALLSGDGDVNEDGIQPAQRKKRSMWMSFYVRLRYYVPIIGWLPTYSIVSNLEGDVIAGITVACLLVPQALSYAQALVKIPPVYGLYTCFVPLLVYSILGTSRQLGVGPEALVAILVGAAISEKSGLKPSPGGSPGGVDPGDSGLAFADSDGTLESIAIANLMGLMVGIFTFFLGFFRLGFLDSVLSRALLRGFVTAVAVVVMIDLSPNLLGIKETFSSALYSMVVLRAPSAAAESEAHVSPIEKLILLLENISSTHVLTAAISVSSIAFLVAMKYLKTQYKNLKLLQLTPEILVLVVFSTILCSLLRWDLAGVDILRDVKGGLIAPKIPEITLPKVRYYLLSAILISVIGFVESIVVAKTYATKYNYSMSPNRELVALGTANILGSIFGGWPAFGSLGRSAVNDASGAKTQLAGFITGIIILVTIIVLLPLFYFLPKAVCSAIIVVAASKLIELHDVYFILRLRAWNDLGLLLLTFLTTLLVSIEAGTLISVGASLLLVVKHTTKTRIAILGKTLVVDSKTGQVKTKFRSISDKGVVERIDGSLVVRIEEGLFFGNTGQLKDRLNRVEIHGELGVHPGEAPRIAIHQVNPTDSPRASGTERMDSADSIENGQVPASHGRLAGIRNVIFDIGAVTAVDATATQILLEIVEAYHHRSVKVCFVKLREACKPWFKRSGLHDLVGEQHFFDKINDAIDFLRTEEIQDPSSHDAPSPGIFISHTSGESDEFSAGSWNPSGQFSSHMTGSNVWVGESDQDDPSPAATRRAQRALLRSKAPKAGHGLTVPQVTRRKKGSNLQEEVVDLYSDSEMEDNQHTADDEGPDTEGTHGSGGWGNI